MRTSLLLILSISLCLFSCKKDDDKVLAPPAQTPCTITPILTTYTASNITDSSAVLSGTIAPPTCDPSVTSQGFVWSKSTFPDLTDSIIVVSGDSITYQLTQLSFEETYYYRAFFTNPTGTYYGNEVSFITDTLEGAVYLGSNGVTIKAYSWAKIGDSGTVKGITYKIVDEVTLRQSISNNNYNVCVTRVTNMNRLFMEKFTFNQPIDSWDVSNVTDMSFMFNSALSFNQPIGSWDVSNVTDMGYMFSGRTIFNQSIDSWDVSSVTNMGLMFAQALKFNQPIDSWDVSNVTEMDGMFAQTNVFNQPLNNWDVSSVTNMERMFYNVSSFNQPLNNWDVSNVTNMGYMFNFTPFNQDLSAWAVVGVFDCINFDNNTPSWTLPKPNFTNCTP